MVRGVPQSNGGGYWIGDSSAVLIRLGHLSRGHAFSVEVSSQGAPWRSGCRPCQEFSAVSRRGSAAPTADLMDNGRSVMAYLLHLTFTPSGDPRVEGWSFRVDSTGHRGWMGGDLPMAARGALAFAQVGRRGRGVMFTLPRAGLFGLCSRRFVIREPGDVRQLENVDVGLLRARHKAATARGVRWASWRAGLLRVVGALRMPAGAWPAVP